MFILNFIYNFSYSLICSFLLFLRFCTFQEHKVIRFRKSVPDNVSPDDGKQRAEREVEFVRFVASCFLGPYTQIPEILRYDAKDITKLSEAIRPLRSGNSFILSKLFLYIKIFIENIINIILKFCLSRR